MKKGRRRGAILVGDGRGAILVGDGRDAILVGGHRPAPSASYAALAGCAAFSYSA